ncbi:MAG: glycosyltransferase family 2 protein [Cyanobacteria bacterium P01_A01_bin.45]|mgnify:CR=1 FL=1
MTQDRNNVYRHHVMSVPEGVIRPLWSVMIPTYNCTHYLRETLESVLAQDPGEEVMQITVVDNCSTEGDPEAIVTELGQGRVEFYRQPYNVGSLGNFETCLELSRGYLIHTLHSDDCVREGFYEKMTSCFTRNPEIGAAFCRSIYIDDKSNWEGFSSLEIPKSGILPREWIERIADVCCISVPSLGVVRREVYEALGGWDSRCGLSGDWEMWARIFAYYPVWYETEALAMWRRHSTSNNVVHAKSSQFIQENFNTIEMIFKSYLPDGASSRGFRNGKQNCAFLALEAAHLLIYQGKTVKAFLEIKRALQYSLSAKVIRSVGRILLYDNMRSLIKRTRKLYDSPGYGHKYDEGLNRVKDNFVKLLEQDASVESQLEDIKELEIGNQ